MTTIMQFVDFAQKSLEVMEVNFRAELHIFLFPKIKSVCRCVLPAPVTTKNSANGGTPGATL